MSFATIWDDLGYHGRRMRILATHASENRKIVASQKLWKRMSASGHTMAPEMATLWSRQAKDKEGNLFWDFNHLENGMVQADVPTPMHPSHENVWKGKWMKETVYLSNEGPMGSTKVNHFLVPGEIPPKKPLLRSIPTGGLMVEVSYPGQEVQVIKAAPGIVQHYLTHDWELPYVKLIS